MTELVAALYVSGALMTIYGVAAAYRRAKRQKAAYDAIKSRNDSLTDPDPVEFFEAAKSDDEQAPGVLRQRVVANEAEIADALASIGVTDPPPSYNDMRLPVEYWSRRAALADALIVFKTDGMVALSGVVVSTVASVMSLYI
ncbi:hypothetical protein [Nocardioides currus]|uniref:Uncharacterized protein n=1 Tax=Nocardioides currus TaxID=2133958 RepID=A0A2R7YR98_9ACTN|nr:hypothetical protein [Nocardioides currus]PUA78937.1 hypothetical protein C7S10_21790 [Nocardioides currus]